MKTAPLIRSFTAFLVAGLCLAGAQAAEPLIVPLTNDSALQIKGPRGMKKEFSPDGTARFSYAIEEARKNHIILIYDLKVPRTAAQMSFELKPSQTEQIRVHCRLQSGKKLETQLDNLGPEWNAYVLDLAALAADAQVEPEPLASVRLVVQANAEAGEQTVELRNWRLE